jgi:hypothetical protein
MHPMLAVFLKLTLLVTVGLVLFFVMASLMKIVLVAALIAALVIAGFFVYTFFVARAKRKLPTNL